MNAAVQRTGSPPGTAVRSFAAAGLLLLLAAFAAGRNTLWGNEVALLKDTLKKSPGKERVHYNLGTALAAEGAFGEALEHFIVARRMNPRRSEYHSQIANIQYLSGRRDEAIEAWLKAVRLDPGNVEALFNLAQALDAAGRPDEADGYFERFIAEARGEYPQQEVMARRRFIEKGRKN